MTFTYTPGAATLLNRVRLLIGDVNEAAPLELRLEDEEISDLPNLFGSNPRRVAAAAAEALAGKLARKPEGSQQPSLMVMPTDRVTHLRRLADRLRREADTGAAPFAGGISVSQHQTVSGDSDVIQPAFARGMLDSPAAGPTTPPDGTTAQPQ